MSDPLFIKQEKKTIIATNQCTSFIAIGNHAIDQGLLLQLPGVALPIFLYLITHADDSYIVKTNPTIISNYLPASYSLESIIGGLKYLEKHDIIKFPEKRDGDYTYQIEVNLDKLNLALPAAKKKDCCYFNHREIRAKILAIPQPARSKLFQAILTFIPPSEDISVLEATIHKWLEDFDCGLIKELIRRVNKWIDKYNNPPDMAFRYLNGIIDDWYKKEISCYQDLKFYDQLYRETRELAAVYGLKNWQNVTSTHMETFKNWLTEGFPLSKEVACLAIKEAIKRKRGASPSLQYIEDNYILPWKKARVRDIEQARKLLKKKTVNTRKTSTSPITPSKNSEDKWDKLNWDFEDIKGF